MLKDEINYALKVLAHVPNAIELVSLARKEYLQAMAASVEGRVRVAVAKPRIKRVSANVYFCTDDTHFSAWANTAEDAYVRWDTLRHIYTRVPRKGFWNIKDCRAWAATGFKSGCSWIGNKKIAGYDHATDELILRG